MSFLRAASTGPVAMPCVPARTDADGIPGTHDGTNSASDLWQIFRWGHNRCKQVLAANQRTTDDDVAAIIDETMAAASEMLIAHHVRLDGKSMRFIRRPSAQERSI
jgi:hypothetical protein